MNLSYFKKKGFLTLLTIIFLCLIFYLFSIVSDVVRFGYDKQSKVIESVKKIIPSHYIKKIKDNVFIISNLEAKNDLLELQLRKYEQGNEGQKFLSKQLDLRDIKYTANFFFLPFKRLDTNLGWKAEINSLRAHYLEIYKEKLFSISGYGKMVYFEKKSFK